jgi:hypothetical protein
MSLRKCVYPAATVAALLMALTMDAGAQTAPAPVPEAAPAKPQWSDLSEIVVRAHIPGPVMWKLTKGDSTVWVLGILAEIPDNLHWNASHLKRVLADANLLIIPGGSAGSDKALDHWTVASHLPKGQHLEDVVSKPTYARFVATVERQRDLPLETYTGYRPVRAGKDLFEDILDTHHIGRYTTVGYVQSIAQFDTAHTKIAYSVNSDLLTEQWLALDEAGNEACLNDFLDGIDYDRKVLPEISNAWARGDLPVVLRDYKETALLTCDLSTPAWKDVYKSLFIDDMTAALDDALQMPGKSVAVVPLSDLLRKDGVLDQLRAQGVTITSPKG